jgi:hypothetical protein
MPLLPAQCLVQQVCEPHPAPLEALDHSRFVRVQIRRINFDDPLGRTGLIRLPASVITARTSFLNAVVDRRLPCQHQRLSRPVVNLPRLPSHPVGVRYGLLQIPPDGSCVLTESLFDDAPVPDAVEITDTRAALLDLAAAPVMGGLQTDKTDKTSNGSLNDRQSEIDVEPHGGPTTSRGRPAPAPECPLLSSRWYQRTPARLPAVAGAVAPDPQRVASSARLHEGVREWRGW